MLLRRSLGGYGLIVLLSASAAGGVIPRDPEVGVDAGTLSSPIGTGTTFSPNNGGGVFGFYNGTGQIITRLVFQTNIQSGLTPENLAGVFTCNDATTSADPNPFFLNCSVGYVSFSGLLTISFYGVNPSDADELPTDQYQANEVGEQEGIPPLKAGCSSTPDAPTCNDIGHFLITLNDGFATSGASGGWSNAANPSIFTGSGPAFSTTVIETAPEPSPAILLATALLFLMAIARRTRRI